MVDCYHFSKRTAESGETYCKECNEIFMVSPVYTGSLAIGKLETRFTAPNTQGLLSFGNLIKDHLGTDKISISDVYAFTDEERSWDREVRVIFSAGTAGMIASIRYSTQNEYTPTGQFFEPSKEEEIAG